MNIKILIILLAIAVFGCGKKEKDFIESAKENLKNNKVIEAIKDYETIVEKYSESENASLSLYEIAKLYRYKIVKNINDTEALTKAINYYQKVVDKYPNSKEAPSSLFMIGFIQANELKNYESASKVYKKFLEIYPEHELAKSAQDELNNLGLTPEEILIKKLTIK